MASIARLAWTVNILLLMISAVEHTRNEFHTTKIGSIAALMVSSVSLAVAKVTANLRCTKFTPFSIL